MNEGDYLVHKSYISQSQKTVTQAACEEGSCFRPTREAVSCRMILFHALNDDLMCMIFNSVPLKKIISFSF